VKFQVMDGKIRGLDKVQGMTELLNFRLYA
jgi:hypothetical protein